MGPPCETPDEPQGLDITETNVIPLPSLQNILRRICHPRMRQDLGMWGIESEGREHLELEVS